MLINRDTFSPQEIQFMKAVCDHHKKTEFTRNELKDFAITQGQQWAPSYIVKNEALKKRDEKGQVVRGYYDLAQAINSTPVEKAKAEKKEKASSEEKGGMEKAHAKSQSHNEDHQPKASTKSKKTKKVQHVESAQ